jgi:trimethylamine--corrinoid protein Co-methyltransferase
MINKSPLPRSRRAGGRQARKSLRAAPLADELRPVRPGLEGGRYQPLDDAAMAAVVDAVYQILEEIGLSQAPQSGIDYMCSVGAIAGEDGRVRFPRHVVNEALEKAARTITLYGQSPEFDLDLTGRKVHFGTAGAAVHLVDVAGNSYKES